MAPEDRKKAPRYATADWAARHRVHAAAASLRSRSSIDTPGPYAITPLHLAAALGNTDAVSWLLAGGANISAGTLPATCTRMYSYDRGSVKQMELFSFLRGVTSSEAARDDELVDIACRLCPHSRTPLQLAILGGHTAAAARLIEAAASGGRLAWHLQCAAEAWLEADEPHAPLLDLLLSHGLAPFAADILPTVLERYLELSAYDRASSEPLAILRKLVLSACVAGGAASAAVCALPPTQQLQLLHAAAHGACPGACLHLIRVHEALPAADRWRAPFLANIFVAAAASNLVPVLEALLAVQREDGSHPFQPGMWAEPPPDSEQLAATALCAAAQADAVDTLSLLLQLGVPVNLADELGATSLNYAASGLPAPAFRAAALLLDRGANPNAVAAGGSYWDEEGRLERLERPLLTACARGSLPLVDMLAAAGADLHAASDEGEVCLSVAISYGHLDLVRRLLSLGCSPNQLPPPDANSGRFTLLEGRRADEAGTLLGAALALVPDEADSAAYAATRPERTAIVHALLAAGADCSLRGHEGQTALEEMVELGFSAAAGLLLEAAPAACGLEELGWSGAMCIALREDYMGTDIGQMLLDAKCAHGLHVAHGDCSRILNALLERTAARELSIRTYEPAEEVEQMVASTMRESTLMAETLAAHGISADVTDRLAFCSPAWRPVVLAAAPAAARWSPALARYHPPRFQAVVQELVGGSSRQAQQRRREREDAAAVKRALAALQPSLAGAFHATPEVPTPPGVPVKGRRILRATRRVSAGSSGAAQENTGGSVGAGCSGGGMKRSVLARKSLDAAAASPFPARPALPSIQPPAALPPQPFTALPPDCLHRILALAATNLSDWL